MISENMLLKNVLKSITSEFRKPNFELFKWGGGKQMDITSDFKYSSII